MLLKLFLEFSETCFGKLICETYLMDFLYNLRIFYAGTRFDKAEGTHS